MPSRFEFIASRFLQSVLLLAVFGAESGFFRKFWWQSLAFLGKIGNPKETILDNEWAKGLDTWVSNERG